MEKASLPMSLFMEISDLLLSGTVTIQPSFKKLNIQVGSPTFPNFATEQTLFSVTVCSEKNKMPKILNKFLGSYSPAPPPPLLLKLEVATKGEDVKIPATGFFFLYSNLISDCFKETKI